MLEKQYDDVWSTRRKIVRTVVAPLIRQRRAKTVDAEPSTAMVETPVGLDKKPRSDNKSAFLISALLVAVSALILRFGGRFAFVQMLGLDFMSDSDIKRQVDDFITYFRGLDAWQYAAFFGSWLVVKTLCIDALTIVLAVSSGVLFGGVLQGTVASVVCSSLASLACFLASRYVFREQAREQIQKRPVFRAVDRAVSKQGLKTVFTLRLSPLLPIPIAAYNYLYGASSVSIFDFIVGISLGSIKPYFLDSYLGIFGKSIIDNTATSDGDVILLVVVAVVVLVGTYATQIASQAWDEMQDEIRELGEIADGDASPASSDTSLFGLLGIKDTDLPSWARDVKCSFQAAASRLETVISDEIAVVENEIAGGTDVSWDVRGLPAEVYPGNRTISPFEGKSLEDNIKDYSIESTIFSLVFISKLFDYSKTS
jgi:uncharacterized membrane protein YdjX (TVP38/TMEM64 family)